MAEPLDDWEVPLLTPLELDEVIALDDALDVLASRDARARSVVECRIFAGLTIEETATALDISPRSVRRSWDTAIAWLRATIAAHLVSGSLISASRTPTRRSTATVNLFSAACWSFPN